MSEVGVELGARRLGAWAMALVLGGVVACINVVSSSGTPFHSDPEPQEALVVREMLENGDWVLPRRNGTELPSKPPLYHWIAATLANILGRFDELAARLPSAIFGALAVSLVAGTGARCWGLGAGLAAGLALATSVEWARWSVTARTDVTFACAVTTALLVGERWLRLQQTADLFGAAVATGIAVLAKGPAGAGFPVMVLGFEAWRRGRLSTNDLPSIGIATAIVAAIAGSWYAAALAQGGWEFFQKQILAENVFRFLASEEGGPSREHSMLYYVPALVGGFMPWSLALPSAIRGAFQDGRDSMRRYLLVWGIVVFSVCTLASGKRSNYLLPLYPAAALLVGVSVRDALERARSGNPSRGLLVVAWVAAGLSAIVGLALLGWSFGFEPWELVLPWLHDRDQMTIPLMAKALGMPGPGLGVAVLCAAVLLALTIARRSWRAAALLVAVLVLATTWAGGSVLRPAEARLKTVRDFASVVRARVGGDPISIFGRPQYSMIYYLDRNVPLVERNLANVARPGWLLLLKREWEALEAAERGRGEVVGVGPRTAIHREGTRLLLVRLGERP